MSVSCSKLGYITIANAGPDPSQNCIEYKDCCGNPVTLCGFGDGVDIPLYGDCFNINDVVQGINLDLINILWDEGHECFCGLFPPTPTPTETRKPLTTPEPTPECPCVNTEVYVDSSYLKTATGNFDKNLNGAVFLDILLCGHSNYTKLEIRVPGDYTYCRSIDSEQTNLYYYYQNQKVENDVVKYHPDCCQEIIPTSTPISSPTPTIRFNPTPTIQPTVTPISISPEPIFTSTPTPTPTPTINLNPTATPTPTPTISGCSCVKSFMVDISYIDSGSTSYQRFINYYECCANFSGSIYLPTNITQPTNNVLITGSGYSNLCVRLNTVRSSKYVGVSNVRYFINDPSNCCDCLPTPTPPKTGTPTPTPPKTGTPVPTPTPTPTPSDTGPTPTPCGECKKFKITITSNDLALASGNTQNPQWENTIFIYVITSADPNCNTTNELPYIQALPFDSPGTYEICALNLAVPTALRSNNFGGRFQYYSNNSSKKKLSDYPLNIIETNECCRGVIPPPTPTQYNEECGCYIITEICNGGPQCVKEWYDCSIDRYFTNVTSYGTTNIIYNLCMYLSSYISWDNGYEIKKIEYVSDCNTCRNLPTPGPTMPTPTPTVTPICICPPSYNPLPDRSGCMYTASTNSTLVQSVLGGNGRSNESYGDFGARIYYLNGNGNGFGYDSTGKVIGGYASKIYTPDGGGPTPMTANAAFWGDANGRLNRIGVWTSNNPCWPNTCLSACTPNFNNAVCASLDTPWSPPYPGTLSVCKTINVSQTKQYYIGLAGDNQIKLEINGKTIFKQTYDYTPSNDQNYKYWHIYPVLLTAGINFIKISNTNYDKVGSFGVEIYDNTLNELKSATAITMLNIVFTTADFREDGPNYNKNFCSSYSCPSGYFYDESTNKCVQRIILSCNSNPTPFPSNSPTPTPTSTLRLLPSLTPTPTPTFSITIPIITLPFPSATPGPSWTPSPTDQIITTTPQPSQTVTKTPFPTTTPDPTYGCSCAIVKFGKFTFGPYFTFKDCKGNTTTLRTSNDVTVCINEATIVTNQQYRLQYLNRSCTSLSDCLSSVTLTPAETSTPTPTPSKTPIPTKSPTPTPSKTPIPTPSPTPTRPTATPKQTPYPTRTPTPTPSPTWVPM